MTGRSERQPRRPRAPREGDAPDPAAPCEWDGCEGAGLYPAPRSRSEIREWRWFCLDHVREYNQQWSYFAGCCEREILAEIAGDRIWNRPSWPLGQGPLGSDPLEDLAMPDAFGFGFAAGARPGPGRAEGVAPERKGYRAALDLFGLAPDASLKAVKARYKTLVKSHHPDANGGDARASRRLVRINEAYATLTAFHGKG